MQSISSRADLTALISEEGAHRPGLEAVDIRLLISYRISVPREQSDQKVTANSYGLILDGWHMTSGVVVSSRVLGSKA